MIYRLTKLSFNFRDSEAIFTEEFLCTVITAGITEQSLSNGHNVPESPDFTSFSSYFWASHCRSNGICLVSSFLVLRDNVLLWFILAIFQSNYSHCVRVLLITCFFLNWLFSSNRKLPISSKISNHFIPSCCVISFITVI